ncbi:MAG: hypothetical protein AB1553_01830 [Nitrospirota bacterium]
MAIVTLNFKVNTENFPLTFSKQRRDFFKRLAEEAKGDDAKKAALEKAEFFGAIVEGLERAQMAGDNLMLIMRNLIQPYIDKYGRETVLDMIMSSLGGK